MACLLFSVLTLAFSYPTGCLAHGLLCLSLQLSLKYVISSGWLCSIIWSSCSFLTPIFVSKYIFVCTWTQIFTCPSLILLSPFDSPLPTGKCSSGLPLLSNLCRQRFSHCKIPRPAVCKSLLYHLPSGLEKNLPLRRCDDVFVCAFKLDWVLRCVQVIGCNLVRK